MHGAEEPAESYVVVEELKAIPCMIGGRSVNECEENAGDNLKAQGDGGGAAEYVPPTGGAGGNVVHGGFDDWSAQTESLLEPVV